MFRKVLIANRGAIATRIIRSLRRLGIRSVAVYAESDRASLHVSHADEAYSLGDGNAVSTYLNQDKILQIAKDCGAQAIHPGYGFLSENAEFCEALADANIAFIGPTPEQIRAFGLKHRAKDIAEAAGVPLIPGTGLLQDLPEVIQEANRIGYPVMLKSTAGGGGIGMQRCNDEASLTHAYSNVKHLGAQNFANDGVFLEKFIEHARHIEIQVLGNGDGQIATLGERDCSSQRRNQKVIEECPAPGLPDDIRQAMTETAQSLMTSIQYRNAGTVEFIYDNSAQAFYFLEVNTRLQVEHGVTEACFQVDLVEWMLKIAAQTACDLSPICGLHPKGHAIQARIYAENPAKQFQPSAGLLTHVEWPRADGLRIDHAIESGSEISAFFDPMLAKVIVHQDSRDAAIEALYNALQHTQLYGVITNVAYVQQILTHAVFCEGRMTTRYLDQFQAEFTGFEVLRAGTMTTVQDMPGRSGYWDIGVPPSGPYDSYSFQLANRLLGNPHNAAGLEITLDGPTLRFYSDTCAVVCGANISIHLDDHACDSNTLIPIKQGQTLRIGAIEDSGMRAYLALTGGIQCPDYLGSKSTFTLGKFGGHCGRALRTGDFIAIADQREIAAPMTAPEIAPITADISHNWQLRVMYGPHGAPDFFTSNDIDTLRKHTWKVHYNSSRTGIRLVGPKPEWARQSGGEAGLHPSNIHDNAYAFGTVDFTGDMPVILGPDGPSLGGFVCPFTVVSADLWKLGQLQAGDSVSFVVVDMASANTLEQAQTQQLQQLCHQPCHITPCDPDSPIVDTLITNDDEPNVVFRQAGDKFLLLEYGELTLDLHLRARVQALLNAVREANITGVLELTPGIRSLQVHYDSLVLPLPTLVQQLKQLDLNLGDTRELSFDSRVVHLPISWDDPACQEAIQKYMQSVRADAPWCPSNLEFIRRINGLDSLDDVQKTVLNARYLVMGLGDVYLGAPVATPLNPAHRLVTTKYNPARTWTAENSVGIGGAYMCIYGMEGPGGYQFVGRTVQMWNPYRQTPVFEQPWLLRLFDQIQFYLVSQEELEHLRSEFPLGRWAPTIETTTISMPQLRQQWQQQAQAIDTFTQQREQAFQEEIDAWRQSGAMNYQAEDYSAHESTDIQLGDNQFLLESAAAGSVWQLYASQGQTRQQGDNLLVLESMKMEIAVPADCDVYIVDVLVEPGQAVHAGQALMILETR